MTSDAVADNERAEGEFDRLAEWTAEVLLRMSTSHRVPGACRGSGNPAALTWLAEALEVSSSTRMLDTGGGLGGPAGWLSERYGTRPVVLEPMSRAAAWSGRLFGLPAVGGSASDLPFRPGSFDAAWALGVLSTVADKHRFLAQVRQTLALSGRLGLLEYVATKPEVPAPPSGNDFLLSEELDELLDSHGFVVVSTVTGDRLPATPLPWQARIDQVKAEVAAAHPDSSIVADAERQEHRFAELLSAGAISTRLIHAVAAD